MKKISKPAAQGAKKKFEDYEQTRPEQLTLFEVFSGEIRVSDDAQATTALETAKVNNRSNLVELYDSLPKFFWSKNPARIDGRFLEILEREFVYKGKTYELRITPARIKDKDGVSRDYYPGKLEESVEAVLRKLVAEGQGVFLDNNAAVTFSLYEIQKELERHNQGASINEIKRALHICSRAVLTLVSHDHTVEIESPMYPALGLRTRDNWKQDGKGSKAFVQFHPLVTEAIKNKSFRMFNYEKSMNLSKTIARQLHKRMSYMYRQASFGNPYTISLTTIIRDFGLTTYENLGKNLTEVKKSLDEMRENHIILNYKIEKTIDTKKRNRVVDALITIIPDPAFIDDVVEANKRAKTIGFKGELLD